MVVENAKEAATTRSVIDNYMGCLLCTWGLVHPMKLVTNDIRADLDGAGVELQPVPWHSQTHKDIATMCATWNYGNKHEELPETTEHLGQGGYSMVKFRDTHFA